MTGRTRGEKKPVSIRQQMNRLVATFAAVISLVFLVVVSILTVYQSQYEGLMNNVTTASEFNLGFKDSIDLKMYYYVIESQYSEGLPISEVEDAQKLAQSLITTTTEKDSLRAITSVLDLCRNLEEKIYLIQETESYDERQLQLENNVYVLTSLIQEYMYNYLYYESVHLNELQAQMTHQIFLEVVVIAAVFTGLVIGLTRHTLKLSRSITEPITQICDRVSQVTVGDLTPREPVVSGEYELATLSVGLEQMVARINQLLQETTEKQESLRKAELALLQAQINPHFLYNTMDTIIWLIEAGKTQEAVDMVSNLSAFFRHSLSKGEDVISLANEESHVTSYLHIQQVRYKDIMSYTIDIDPAIRDARLPKLTLQPLVENALYHGIKLKRGQGRIEVKGRAEDNLVVLTVTDDGVGMSPQRLEELNRSMDGGGRVGFGLATVHERLRLLFGSSAGLTLSSTEGVGTTVTVRLPRQTGQTEREAER
ncbi:MAG: sensor histidine kinase [Clostridiales bacterium]|nr:sensor histidine kinase [Clostridiales bacterium]